MAMRIAAILIALISLWPGQEFVVHGPKEMKKWEMKPWPGVLGSTICLEPHCQEEI